MNKEELFYINLLADHLNQRKTEAVFDLDFKRLYEIGISQNTSGIIYTQIKDFIPNEDKKNFTNSYMSEIYNYANRISITNEIKDNFNKQHIRYTLVKGPVVAELYPTPCLRTMGDSDFVVYEDDIDKAYKVMDELGFTCEASLHERAYYKNNMEVEIHDRLSYGDDEKEINFSNRLWDYVKDNNIEDSYHFVYLLIHLKKHILEMGVGFRQFMDLGVMMKNNKLDYNFINDEIEKLNLKKYYDVCLALVDKWFGIKCNEVIKLEDDFIEKETLKIFKNGVHGFENDDNKINTSMNQIKDGKLSSKIKYMFNLYFPPYDYFIRDLNYKFLINKKYLLPIAWLKRFYLSLKSTNVLWEIKRSFSSFFMSKKDIEKKNDDLKKWGL